MTLIAVRSSRARVLGFFSLFFLAGCGPPPDAKSLGLDPAPEIPVITSLTYLKSSAVQTVNPPFLTALTLYSDLQTGICTNSIKNAEVTISGTFDNILTDHFLLTGPTVQQVSLTGTTFSIKACIPLGSTALSFSAVSSKGISTVPIKFSVSNFPYVTTLATGHPTYPNPGFRSYGSANSLSSLNGSSLTASQISLSDVTNKTTASTGNTGFSFSSGYANIINKAR